MTQQEVIDILLANRPERPRALQQKKLQQAIDEVIALLTAKSEDDEKYQAIKAIVDLWGEDRAFVKDTNTYDAIYFHRILDVFQDTSD